MRAERRNGRGDNATWLPWGPAPHGGLADGGIKVVAAAIVDVALVDLAHGDRCQLVLQVVATRL